MWMANSSTISFKINHKAQAQTISNNTISKTYQNANPVEKYNN